MKNINFVSKCLIAFISLFSYSVVAHGPVTPQSIDTSALPQLGKDWLERNPYRKQTGKALQQILSVGASAYNQNCARCHGLGGISGGIAPDLRELATDYEGDEWYGYRVVNGAVRDGAVFMPKMVEHLTQEALWSIRSWLESVAEKQPVSEEKPVSEKK